MSTEQEVPDRHDPAGFLSRLQEWRDNGSAPDIAYCAGNDLFAKDVTALLAEAERLREKLEDCSKRYASLLDQLGAGADM